MNRKTAATDFGRNMFAIIVCILLIAAIICPTAMANSAEPPGLTIVVNSPPDDLKLLIRFVDGSVTGAVELQSEQKAWESYYRFFYGMVAASNRPSLEGAALVASSSEYNFECPLPESAFKEYNNLLTLDLANQAIREGQSPGRTFLLISLRVVLTMLIEGVIFYAFGYRSKASWIAFIVVNMITQSALNALLSGPNLGSYWFFGFAFCEIIILIVELVTFSIALKEHKKSRAVLFALTANIASLILGGILISYLPV